MTDLTLGLLNIIEDRVSGSEPFPEGVTPEEGLILLKALKHHWVWHPVSESPDVPMLTIQPFRVRIDGSDRICYYGYFTDEDGNLHCGWSCAEEHLLDVRKITHYQYLPLNDPEFDGQ